MHASLLLAAVLTSQYLGGAGAYTRVPYNTGLGGELVRSQIHRNNGPGYSAPGPDRPHTISFNRGPMDYPGYNGVVTRIDTTTRLIYTDLAAESVAFRYGVGTRFRTMSGNFKRLAPGDLINVDGTIITIVNH